MLGLTLTFLFVHAKKEKVPILRKFLRIVYQYPRQKGNPVRNQFTKTLIPISVLLLIVLQGCAMPRQPNAPASYDQGQYPPGSPGAICQQQLGPPPTLESQLGTALAGALIGAGGNAAFNAIVGGDPGRGAALGALGGGAIGSTIAVMSPDQYQMALSQCIQQVSWDMQQQREAEYQNRPCVTRRSGVNDGRGWRSREEYGCEHRTYSAPPNIPKPYQ
jgi:hypothetical protein